MNPLNISNPFYGAYKDYSTMFGAIETIGGCLYDTQAYVSGGAGTIVLNFFTVAPAATLDITNMEIPSQLPSPKAFLVRAIRWFVKHHPTSTARAAVGAVQPGIIDNLAQLANTGVLRLTIGSKVYSEFPLWMIPAGGGCQPIMAMDGDTPSPGELVDFGVWGVPSPDNALVLTQPLFIVPQINFNARLTWPVPITLTNAANVNLCLVLDGDLLRGV